MLCPCHVENYLREMILSFHSKPDGWWGGDEKLANLMREWTVNKCLGDVGDRWLGDERAREKEQGVDGWVGERLGRTGGGKDREAHKYDQREGISDTYSFPSLPLCTVIREAPILGPEKFRVLLFQRNLTFWISPTLTSTSMSCTCKVSGVREPLIAQTEISCQLDA